MAKTGSAGITAANLKSLARQQVQIGGIADSSPIYLRGVAAGGKTRDLFVVTTSYGKAVAVDAASGRVVWRFTISFRASPSASASRCRFRPGCWLAGAPASPRRGRCPWPR